MILTLENTYDRFNPVPQRGKEIEWVLFNKCFYEFTISPMENKVYLRREYKGNKDFFMVELDEWGKGIMILIPFLHSFTNASEQAFIKWLEQFIYTEEQYRNYWSKSFAKTEA